MARSPAPWKSLDSRALARAVRIVRPARFLSRAIFPALVPVTWARLGDFTLAAIPVEATTAAGWAIRQEARADAIVGLANEYIGYTASAPEYELQQYEGASTLLGPGQAAGLARLLSLAAAGRGDPPSAETVPAQRFARRPAAQELGSFRNPCWCAASATWWTKTWNPSSRANCAAWNPASHASIGTKSPPATGMPTPAKSPST